MNHCPVPILKLGDGESQSSFVVCFEALRGIAIGWFVFRHRWVYFAYAAAIIAGDGPSFIPLPNFSSTVRGMHLPYLQQLALAFDQRKVPELMISTILNNAQMRAAVCSQHAGTAGCETFRAGCSCGT